MSPADDLTDGDTIATDEDLAALRAVLRQFFDKEIGTREHPSVSRGADDELWLRMANDLELMGFSIPTEFGGSGFSWTQHSVVFEELGRALSSVPYFSTVAQAATALLASADVEAMSRYLPDIAAGRSIAAVATIDAVGSLPTEAGRSAGRYTISGEKHFVIAGHQADLVFVTATVSGSPALFSVDATADGLSALPMPSLDVTRPLARIVLRGVPGQLIGEIGAAPAYLQRAGELAGVALASEEVGGIEKCLQMSLQHAAMRHQFGRPIGSFQAIKHRLVDTLVNLELSRGLIADACSASNGHTDERALASYAAQAFCGDAYRAAAAMAIHVHGGMGFTWENEAHLHFRRAYANSGMRLSDRALRDSIAELCFAAMAQSQTG